VTLLAVLPSAGCGCVNLAKCQWRVALSDTHACGRRAASYTRTLPETAALGEAPEDMQVVVVREWSGAR